MNDDDLRTAVKSIKESMELHYILMPQNLVFQRTFEQMVTQ